MIELTREQQIVLGVVIRFAALLSFTCCCAMVWTIVRSPYYRSRMYHRIMLGCALNIMILNANGWWGGFAVPEGTPGFVMAMGNTATCTAQGFFYTMAFVVPSYYVALSLLCFFAVGNKFKIEKYQWIEKYIHVGVYLFPLASGSYLLSVEAYNPSITGCYFQSNPIGCGDESPDGVECIRGPSNHPQLSRWLIGMPFGILMLLPVVLLATMCLRVRLFQGPSGREVASSVAKQSLLYLLALYWTYTFRFLFLSFSYQEKSYMFSLHLLGNAVEMMQGVWISMAYYYFRSENPMDISGSSTHNTTITKEGNSLNEGQLGSGPTAEATSDWMTKPHFSIFDGSSELDPNSPWSQYLYDEGEDEEYVKDCGEYDDSAFDMERAAGDS